MSFSAIISFRKLTSPLCWSVSHFWRPWCSFVNFLSWCRICWRYWSSWFGDFDSSWFPAKRLSISFTQRGAHFNSCSTTMAIIYSFSSFGCDASSLIRLLCSIRRIHRILILSFSSSSGAIMKFPTRVCPTSKPSFCASTLSYSSNILDLNY